MTDLTKQLQDLAEMLERRQRIKSSQRITIDNGGSRKRANPRLGAIDTELGRIASQIEGLKADLGRTKSGRLDKQARLGLLETKRTGLLEEREELMSKITRRAQLDDLDPQASMPDLMPVDSVDDELGGSDLTGLEDPGAEPTGFDEDTEESLEHLDEQIQDALATVIQNSGGKVSPEDIVQYLRNNLVSETGDAEFLQELSERTADEGDVPDAPAGGEMPDTGVEAPLEGEEPDFGGEDLEDGLDTEIGGPDEPAFTKDDAGAEPDAEFGEEGDLDIGEPEGLEEDEGSVEDELGETEEHESEETPEEESAEHEPGAEDTDDADDDDKSEEDDDDDEDEDEESEDDEDDEDDSEDSEESDKKKSGEGGKDGDLEPDLMLNERVARRGVDAKFTPHKDLEKSHWTVSVNGQPRLRVFAAKAYPSLSAKPDKRALGGDYNFPTFYDAFASDLYSRTLIKTVKEAGVIKTAAACRGELIKTAQTGAGMPQSIAPGQGVDNPRGNTAMPSLPPEDIGGTPEGEGDTSLNPSPDTEEQVWDSEPPSKLLFTEYLGQLAAPAIANGDYSVEEAEEELTAIMGDPEAAAEFFGSLREKAEALMEDSEREESEKAEAEQQGNAPQAGLDNAVPGAPAGGMGAPPVPGVPGGPTQGGMPMQAQASQKAKQVIANLRSKVAELESKLSDSTKETEVEAKKRAALERERTLSKRYEAAKQFVASEMQPRGLVPSVETYMRNHAGVSQRVAITKVNEAIVEKAKEITKMDDTSFEVFAKSVRDFPTTESAPRRNDEERESAARQGNSLSKVVFAQKREEKVGLDAVLPETLGTSLTEKARAHNASRTRKSVLG